MDDPELSRFEYLMLSAYGLLVSFVLLFGGTLLIGLVYVLPYLISIPASVILIAATFGGWSKSEELEYTSRLFWLQKQHRAIWSLLLLESVVAILLKMYFK